MYEGITVPSLLLFECRMSGRAPGGASARAHGAAHVAAQEGNTQSLKLLYDLDRGDEWRRVLVNFCVNNGSV